MTREPNLYTAIYPVYIKKANAQVKRVVEFDPADVYVRIDIDPYQRHQKLSLTTMFPNLETGKCACGCGKELTGRQRRWALKTCSSFAFNVFCVIRGDAYAIRQLMYSYLEYKCAQCKCAEKKNNLLHLEHMLAVQNGGGGCWLGNYQFLCERCHKVKTAADNKMKYKPYATALIVQC